MSRRPGVQVLSGDYRLAPEHPAPAAVEDAYAVVRRARRQAAELGISRLAVGDAPRREGGPSPAPIFVGTDHEQRAGAG